MKKRIFGMLLMGAMVVASVSMFTSCKDYDDDINKLQSQIDAAALKADLESLRTSLATDLANAKSALETAIAAKANASDLEGLAKKSDLEGLAKDEELTSLAATVATLNTQLEAVQTAIGENDITKMAETIAAVTGDLKALETALASKADAADLASKADAAAVKAVETNLELQQKALDELKKQVEEIAKKNVPAYDDTAVKADIKDLQDAVKALQNAGYVTKSDLEKAINKLNADLTAKIPNVSLLTALVNKVLTSVTLIPQLYINGIEAIQFRSIKYVPQTFGPNKTPKALQWNPGGAGITFKAYQHSKRDGDKLADAQDGKQYDVAGTLPIWADWTTSGIYDHQLVNDGKAVTIDNGKTEAYYRLSPAGVKEDEINTKGLEFACTTANTETRAPSITTDDPVKPTFKELKNGVMTVTLEKTVTSSLAYTGSVDDQDGTVKNSKLGTVKGNIVSLKVPRLKNEKTGQEAADIYSEFNLLDEVTITPRIAALNKLADGKYVFNGSTADTKHDGTKAMQYHYIDSTHIYQSMVDKGLYVKEVISYKESFDLRKLVTGCYEQNGKHIEITKDELKEYGIEFFFAIPKTVYNTTDNAFNKTDQQPFAVLAKDGYTISSKLPSEAAGSGNMAVNGKEPIVRVMMIDTKNHKLIDQAYFKIKWADTAKDKEPFKVEEKATQTLKCEGNEMTVNWKQFIEDVYAKLDGSYGQNGLDWDKFRLVYPQTQVYFGSIAATNLFKESADKSQITFNSSTKGDVTINWLNTEKAPEADANHLTWKLDATDIGTIDTKTREKTLEAKVIFKSAQPKDYGNVEMTLKFTVKLPEKPSIVGYNDNQWFVPQEKFYVYPVQYGTTLDGASWKTEVKYDFNVMQQFTVTTDKNNAKNSANWKAGTYTNWIVKGVPMDCGTWDLQFAQSQMNTYKPAYTGAEPLKDEGVAFAAFKAYELDKSNKLALNLKWLKDGDAHKSWQNKEAEPFARLVGLKENKDQIIPLINDLLQETESDGWTPKKPEDPQKYVTMKVWAKYNAFNVEEITTFKAYLLTPIRISHNVDGIFEDLHISGTVVDAKGTLAITDFAGYAVAQKRSGRTNEQCRYETELWKYYGIEEPVFDTKNIVFGVKMSGGDLVVANEIKLNETATGFVGGKPMLISDVSTNTAGAFNWSVEYDATTGELIFFNQTGRALDKPFNVFVPVTVKHYFGEAQQYVEIPVYPKGQGDKTKVKEGPKK